MTDEGQEKEVTRQDKRAEKLRKKRGKMQQHGKGLSQIYKNAVGKREKS
ncbi:MAG TPA: hypothetical protein VMB24_02275 [Dehalococcoidales bacterium]|nr:hypothetical protein [Dehalococcoidales bacterium]